MGEIDLKKSSGALVGTRDGMSEGEWHYSRARVLDNYESKWGYGRLNSLLGGGVSHLADVCHLR